MEPLLYEEHRLHYKAPVTATASSPVPWGTLVTVGNEAGADAEALTAGGCCRAMGVLAGEFIRPLRAPLPPFPPSLLLHLASTFGCGAEADASGRLLAVIYPTFEEHNTKALAKSTQSGGSSDEDPMKALEELLSAQEAALNSPSPAAAEEEPRSETLLRCRIISMAPNADEIAVGRSQSPPSYSLCDIPLQARRALFRWGSHGTGLLLSMASENSSTLSLVQCSEGHGPGKALVTAVAEDPHPLLSEENGSIIDFAVTSVSTNAEATVTPPEPSSQSQKCCEWTIRIAVLHAGNTVSLLQLQYRTASKASRAILETEGATTFTLSRVTTWSLHGRMSQATALGYHEKRNTLTVVGCGKKKGGRVERDWVALSVRVTSHFPYFNALQWQLPRASGPGHESAGVRHRDERKETEEADVAPGEWHIQGSMQHSTLTAVASSSLMGSEAIPHVASYSGSDENRKRWKESWAKNLQRNWRLYEEVDGTPLKGLNLSYHQRQRGRALFWPSSLARHVSMKYHAGLKVRVTPEALYYAVMRSMVSQRRGLRPGGLFRSLQAAEEVSAAESETAAAPPTGRGNRLPRWFRAMTRQALVPTPHAVHWNGDCTMCALLDTHGCVLVWSVRRQAVVARVGGMNKETPLYIVSMAWLGPHTMIVANDEGRSFHFAVAPDPSFLSSDDSHLLPVLHTCNHPHGPLLLHACGSSKWGNHPLSVLFKGLRPNLPTKTRASTVKEETIAKSHNGEGAWLESALEEAGGEESKGEENTTGIESAIYSEEDTGTSQPSTQLFLAFDVRSLSQISPEVAIRNLITKHAFARANSLARHFRLDLDPLLEQALASSSSEHDIDLILNQFRSNMRVGLLGLAVLPLTLEKQVSLLARGKEALLRFKSLLSEADTGSEAFQRNVALLDQAWGSAQGHALPSIDFLARMKEYQTPLKEAGEHPEVMKLFGITQQQEEEEYREEEKDDSGFNHGSTAHRRLAQLRSLCCLLDRAYRERSLRVDLLKRLSLISGVTITPSLVQQLLAEPLVATALKAAADGAIPLLRELFSRCPDAILPYHGTLVNAIPLHISPQSYADLLPMSNISQTQTKSLVDAVAQEGYPTSPSAAVRVWRRLGFLSLDSKPMSVPKSLAPTSSIADNTEAARVVVAECLQYAKKRHSEQRMKVDLRTYSTLIGDREHYRDIWLPSFPSAANVALAAYGGGSFPVPRTWFWFLDCWDTCVVQAAQPFQTLESALHWYNTRLQHYDSEETYLNNGKELFQLLSVRLPGFEPQRPSREAQGDSSNTQPQASLSGVGAALLGLEEHLGPHEKQLRLEIKRWGRQLMAFHKLIYDCNVPFTGSLPQWMDMDIPDKLRVLLSGLTLDTAVQLVSLAFCFKYSSSYLSLVIVGARCGNVSFLSSKQKPT